MGSRERGVYGDPEGQGVRSVGFYIPKEGGEPVPYDQKYVDHLRRKADGSWEIFLHMWSPNDTMPNTWH